jgi:sodium/proline symporter
MEIKLFILAIYFGILFFIGWKSSKKVNNIKDFFVGGKKLGFWVTAFSTRATGESAWLLLGLTGLGAVVGVSAFWVVFGEVLGVSIAWIFMAKKFKRITDKYNSITIPDFLVSHFKSKTNHLRILAALFLSFFIIIYVSAQIDATGSAFEAFLGWNYFVGAIVGYAIVLFYITFGGFIAVAWSDFIQGSLMFLALCTLPFIGLFFLNQEMSFWQSIAHIDPSLVSVWGLGGFNSVNVATIIGYSCIGLAFLGSPQIFVRFMSIKNEAEIDRGKWVAIFFTFFSDCAAVLIGIMARYFFTKAGYDVEETLGNNGQNSLILVVEYLLPTAFVGIYMAVILAAIMSTVDSLLVLASSALVLDLYQKILNPTVSLKKLMKISRIATFVLASLALLVALLVAISTPERTIFWFVLVGFHGIAASFCPTIILALFWKRFTEKGAMAAIISGFLGVLFFKFIMPRLDGIGIYFDKIAKLARALLIGLLSGYLVSKLFPDKPVTE